MGTEFRDWVWVWRNRRRTGSGVVRGEWRIWDRDRERWRGRLGAVPYLLSDEQAFKLPFWTYDRTGRLDQRTSWTLELFWCISSGRRDYHITFYLAWDGCGSIWWFRKFRLRVTSRFRSGPTRFPYGELGWQRYARRFRGNSIYASCLCGSCQL